MGKTSAEVRREGRKKGKRGVKDRKKVEGMKAQVKEGEKEGRIESKGEGKKTRGVMGKEKEKEGTEADSGNIWDSGKGVEEERREGDMRKEDRKEDDERVREKDNRRG